jgi:eukaryotic-like serine/threonine-protein kinase
MPLVPGTQLGSYEVVALLGVGGMGEVYRARDSKLGREVALKVIPEGFTQDPQRMARFEREAKLLALFNHPNIASIYGLEDSTSVRALVLELAEGPTLADRIKQGAVPMDEALQIAKQIAEALEYAHERNVVHRDLKPANIKLTSKDEVKVLDFGLAKAIEDDANSIDISTSPTISQMATQAGIILGTAAYMSPEQAKGKSVNRRADIWAFGCLLLEMLSGKTAFSGETVTDTLAAVVLKEPDWSQLPTSTPDAILLLLQRCLTKDERQRLQAIGDARISIDEVLTGTAKEERPPALQAQPGFQWLSILPWALLIRLAIVSTWFHFSAVAPTTQTASFTAALVTGTDIHDPMISPDGRAVAYEHDGKLWLRSIKDLEPKALEGTEDGANPFWSPDSRSIGYFHKGELRRISAQGGPSTLICQLISDRQFPPATWGADDHIIFQDIPNGFFEVSAQGGTPQLFTKPDPAKDELILRDPHFLADGKTLVMIVRRPGPGLQLDTIAVQPWSIRHAVLQIPGARLSHVVSSEKTGHLLFFMAAPNPGVWAVPFSFSKLETVGKPFLVQANVQGPSVTLTGDLVYSSMPADNLQDLAWTDKSGNVLSTFCSRKDGIRDPTISPDGRQVAFESAGARWEVWIADSIRNTAIRMAGDTYAAGFP